MTEQELKEKIDYLLVNLQQSAEMRQGNSNYQQFAEGTRKEIFALIKGAGFVQLASDQSHTKINLVGIDKILSDAIWKTVKRRGWRRVILEKWGIE